MFGEDPAHGWHSPAHLGVGIHAIVHGRIGSGWSSVDVRCGTLGQLGLLFRNGQKQASPRRRRNFERVVQSHNRVFEGSPRVGGTD